MGKAPAAFGLVGARTTETGLSLPAKVTYDQMGHVLEMIGTMARATAWWGGDALLYAEAHFDEGQFSQLSEALGWAPNTRLNVLAVCRAFPPERRHLELTFGHHASVAGLDPEDADHWLARAQEGEELPNKEKRIWSVAKLRSELRALSPKPPEPEAAEGNDTGNDLPHATDGGASFDNSPPSGLSAEGKGLPGHSGATVPEARDGATETPQPSSPKEPSKAGDEPARGEPHVQCGTYLDVDVHGRCCVVGIYKSGGGILISTRKVSANP